MIEIKTADGILIVSEVESVMKFNKAKIEFECGYLLSLIGNDSVDEYEKPIRELVIKSLREYGVVVRAHGINHVAAEPFEDIIAKIKKAGI